MAVSNSSGHALGTNPSNRRAACRPVGRHRRAERRVRPLRRRAPLARYGKSHARARGVLRRRVQRRHAAAETLRHHRRARPCDRRAAGARGGARLAVLQSPPFPAAPAESRASDFAAVLERVQAICRDQVAPYAAEVDRDARFRREAFAALRAERLLAAYVPVEHGGLGLGVAEISQICETLGRACGSTGLIFAMHQIQVACIVHHALGAPWFRNYARELAAEQHLLASATTEMGVGGDLRSSICAVQVLAGRFTLTKQAPAISYGEAADASLPTARRSPALPPHDQALVLARRNDYRLERLSGWDTLGMRGTCSCGFVLHAAGDAAQILPVPYAPIHARASHPFPHIAWASVWVGIARAALGRAVSVG